MAAAVPRLVSLSRRDMDDDDQLENGAYTFRLGDDGAGLLQKGGETIWTTAELDFDPYFGRADISPMTRGDAVAATWIFRGDESPRRRGWCRVDSPAWIVRGDTS